MALTLGDNFSYQGAKPLDARLKYDTLAAMKAVADATMYDGCMAYCVATDKTYQWKSTNTVDEDTGKWREFSSGGDTIQVDTLPTAGADELGNVYQYIGATDVYTHGYFYECVSDGESTPTYSWEVCDVVDTLSASDVTDIKNAFAVQTYVDRGIIIDERGTESVVGVVMDSNGDEHKLYQKVLNITLDNVTVDENNYYPLNASVDNFYKIEGFYDAGSKTSIMPFCGVNFLNTAMTDDKMEGIKIFGRTNTATTSQNSIVIFVSSSSWTSGTVKVIVRYTKVS